MTTFTDTHPGDLTACAHCTLPVPPALVRADDASFCCDGCAAVYAAINGVGLGQYYRLRASARSDADPERASDERQVAYGGSPVRMYPGDCAGRGAGVNADHKHNGLLSRTRCGLVGGIHPPSNWRVCANTPRGYGGVCGQGVGRALVGRLLGVCRSFAGRL